MPSCLSGGRRIVKCTRSTDGSLLSRLRQVRSPLCGSPEINNTRSRSRTPVTTMAARLLAKVISPPGAASTSISKTLGPPCTIGRLMLRSMPIGRSKVALSVPSRVMRTLAWVAPMPAEVFDFEGSLRDLADDAVGRARWTARRRSRSSCLPAIRPCTGPSPSGLAGTSCTCPSVSRIAPARRSRGTSP